MDSAPGQFFKRTLGRITARILKDDNTRQFEREENNMHSAEIETSSLLDKSANQRPFVLPDGTQQVPLGSGVITGILGEGGSSILYEISNAQLGLQRAVKLLKPNNTRASYEQFIKEFRIGAQLNHPNVGIVHSLNQWQKLPFIEMEKINGYTLNEIVSQFGPLPLGLCTSIGIIICKVLEYLHSCSFELEKIQYTGLLHLDLKPSNIILSESGTLKIMDFGLATPIHEAKSGLYPRNTGSPQYASPELLFNSDPPDERSDLYSLGCLLYEMVSGQKVFSGSDPKEVLQNRQLNSFTPLKKLTKSIPSELVEIIDQCLMHDKDKRPSNAFSIRSVLESIHPKFTSLTPESAISLYIEKRKHNAPFTLPKPHHHTRSILVYSGITILLIISVLFMNGMKTPLQPNFLKNISNSIALKGSESKAKTKRIKKDPVSGTLPTDNPVGSPDFYAPSLSTDQAILIETLRKAWMSRQFDEMLKVIDQMPAELAKSKEVMLYRLRALGRNGVELGKLLESEEIVDGEYYFHKARYYFSNKEYEKTVKNLENAEALPSEFLDKRILGREVQLYRARSLTALFRTEPTSDNLKLALQSWDRLLQLTKDSPNSLHAKEAEKEKQNLFAEASWRGIE